MIRSIYILIFIFSYSISFSQGYFFNISNFEYRGTEYCYFTSEIKVRVFYKDGSSEEVYKKFGSFKEYNKNSLVAISKPNEIEKFYVDIRMKTESYDPAYCDNDLITSSVNVALNQGCDIGKIDEYDGNAYIKFSYRYFPDIELDKGVDNIIVLDENLNIKATEGFPSNLYTWQYQIGDSYEWITIENFHKSTLNLKPKDFLQINDVGVTIRFRINSCEAFVSRIVSYYLVESPPRIKSIRTEKTSCSYSKDGFFHVNFERNLKNEEKMLIALYDEVPALSNTYKFYKSFSTSFLKDIEQSYRYTWSDKLDSGNYQIKYQTVNRGRLQEDWTKLKASKTFTIQKSAQVKFKVKKLNGENCFKAGDGKIEIYDVEGEENRKFLYKIDKVNGANLKSIIDWTVFTGSSVIVEKLGSIGLGKYRIQVKDEKDCFFKDPE